MYSIFYFHSYKLFINNLQHILFQKWQSRYSVNWILSFFYLINLNNIIFFCIRDFSLNNVVYISKRILTVLLDPLYAILSLLFCKYPLRAVLIIIFALYLREINCWMKQRTRNMYVLHNYIHIHRHILVAVSLNISFASAWTDSRDTRCISIECLYLRSIVVTYLTTIYLYNSNSKNKLRMTVWIICFVYQQFSYVYRNSN